MSLLTEQEIDVEANKTLIQLQGLTRHMWRSYGRAIETKVIEKIKAQEPVAFEYNGEPWFDGNSWHEQKELAKDKKVAEFKAYLGKPPVPLYRLPEGE